jgi:hypothetical protein
LRVFEQVRREPVSGGAREPVGVAVDFDLTLDNLKGRNVEVHWSMYRTGAGSPLESRWAQNRTVFSGRVDGSKQTVSRQFWVPLPPRHGHYFLQLSAWDGRTRLDYSNSKPPFR